MARQTSFSCIYQKKRKKRPGVISKSKTSTIKASRHYKKAYRGQGR